MEHRCCNSSLDYSQIIFIRDEVLREKYKECCWFFEFLTERSVRPTCLQNFPVGFVPRPIFSPDNFIFQNKKYMSLNRLGHGVGEAVECILWFIHPSNPARDTYPNRPKGHKILGLILVGQEMKVIKRGMEPVEVFNFYTRIFQTKFYTLLRDMCM